MSATETPVTGKATFRANEAFTFESESAAFTDVQVDVPGLSRAEGLNLLVWLGNRRDQVIPLVECHGHSGALRRPLAIAKGDRLLFQIADGMGNTTEGSVTFIGTMGGALVPVEPANAPVEL